MQWANEFASFDHQLSPANPYGTLAAWQSGSQPHAWRNGAPPRYDGLGAWGAAAQRQFVGVSPPPLSFLPTPVQKPPAPRRVQ